MGLFAPEGGSNKTFEKPDAGEHQVVCCDVIDRGVMPGWEGRPTKKVDLIFQTAQVGTDGKRLELLKRFTLSMNEKATLRKFLEAWRRRKFEFGEAGQFDLTNLIGANGVATVSHAPSKTDPSKVFANIEFISPPERGTELLKPEGYERRQPKSLLEKQPGQPF